MADVTSPFAFPYPEDTDLVRDGASDIENLAEGVNDYLAGGYLYAGTVYFTSSSTFAKADPLGTGDIGLRAIRVRMVGGGGGSGGCSTTSAAECKISGAGGGAAYAESFITDMSTLSASETVTRGAGGTAGAAGNNAGGAGGTSSFGTLVTAGGGSGGDAGSDARTATILYGNTAGGGSSTATGDLVIAGGNGQIMPSLPTNTFGGAGGPSQLSGSARRTFSSTTGEDGQPGQLYGGGASSAHNSENQGSNRAGGAGANGIVIVDVFI
jgi:hypothetical protein